MIHSQENMSWSVSALVHAIADTLKARFSAICVRGEVSSFSQAASGHCYFTLKDESSQIRCAMFQRAAKMLSFDPANGDEVEIRGRLAIYEQRGELQLIVEDMRPVGQGRLLEQFQKLKNKLEQEGLFNPQHKKAIPEFAHAVGVVSSIKAAALHDILTAFQRRAPHVRVIVYPSSVQGIQAVGEIVQAIQTAQVRNEVNTLLVCRGGGSLEDLWCFNEEAVVRAIATCTLPTICGVGHETDFTLSDFAADLRAPTPTAAAELAAQPQQEIVRLVAQHARTLGRQIHIQLDYCAQRIDRAHLSLRQPSMLLHAPQQRLAQAQIQMRLFAQQRVLHQQQTLENLQIRWPQISQQLQQKKETSLNNLFLRWQRQAPVKLMQNQFQKIEKLASAQKWIVQQQLTKQTRYLEQNTQTLNTQTHQQLDLLKHRLQNLKTRLNAMNPSKVLSRGYAWVSDGKGRVLCSAQQLRLGKTIQTQFADGKALATVTQSEMDLMPTLEDSDL